MATEMPNETPPSLCFQAGHMLQNALLMTEMGMDMKEKCCQGDKYVCYLRSIAIRASKNVRNLRSTSNQFLILAQKVVANVITLIDSTPNLDYAVYKMKLDYEKLLAIIERELAEIDDLESIDLDHKVANVSERIRYLEAKQQKVYEGPTCGVQQSCSVRSVKSDVDEKYPENWSRDSLIDLNNVVNLPPVPEDIFTCFANKQPTRTSSLSSLKGMRKVKLFLQRAANNSDDEDSSDTEDHEVMGDGDDKMATSSKKHLGNIKEETQQD